MGHGVDGPRHRASGLASQLGVGQQHLFRPLRHLAERMRDIASGDGDLTQRLPVRGRNESAELAIQFNAFAVKIHDVLVDVRASSESSIMRPIRCSGRPGPFTAHRPGCGQPAADLDRHGAISSTVGHTSIVPEASGLSQTASQLA